MLKDYIEKRKSTRKYDMNPLDEDTLKEIRQFASSMRPLVERIQIDYRFASAGEVKNILPIKAPHYIIISSDPEDLYLPNVGFLFQQMDLFLSSKGLGSCWLGLAKPSKNIHTEKEFVIILAFGRALGSPYRDMSDFRRKSLSEICDTSDERLECARLAPSASNSQPWYFITDQDTFHVYRVETGTLRSMIYKRMNQIDIGIALAHLYLSYPKFSYTFQTDPKHIKGYEYMGTVSLI
ncbi:MAG: nitroreductase family protein [Sphaerochaetaceae bacterium]